MLALTYCKPAEPPPTPMPSTDVHQLLSIIKLPVKVESAKWEVFFYPEDQPSFIPASTEQKILIAEVRSPESGWFTNADDRPVFVPTYNAVRHWLSSESKILLQNERLDTDENNCNPLSTTLRSGRAVDGYVCKSGQSALVYIVLFDESDYQGPQ